MGGKPYGHCFRCALNNVDNMSEFVARWCPRACMMGWAYKVVLLGVIDNKYTWVGNNTTWESDTKEWQRIRGGGGGVVGLWQNITVKCGKMTEESQVLCVKKTLVGKKKAVSHLDGRRVAGPAGWIWLGLAGKGSTSWLRFLLALTQRVKNCQHIRW